MVDITLTFKGEYEGEVLSLYQNIVNPERTISTHHLVDYFHHMKRNKGEDIYEIHFCTIAPEYYVSCAQALRAKIILSYMVENF